MGKSRQKNASVAQKAVRQRSLLQSKGKLVLLLLTIIGVSAFCAPLIQKVLKDSHFASPVHVADSSRGNFSEVSVKLQKAESPADSEFQKLLSTLPPEFRTADIAAMNLLCAQGLPGSEDLDIPKCMAMLDAWAQQVDFETKRNFHHFQKHPEEYGNSEAIYRAGMLITVLQQDLGVHYDPEQAKSSLEALEAMKDPQKMEGMFFSEDVFRNSKLMFINGALNEKRTGTCASLPVLYTAVGRRLGYPLKLGAAKIHYFVRWDDGETCLNFDGSGQGFNVYPDEHFKNWPVKVSEEDVRKGYYIKSMTPAQELATFLFSRADYLRVAYRYREAENALQMALRLWQNHPDFQMGYEKLLENEAHARDFQEKLVMMDQIHQTESMLPMNQISPETRSQMQQLLAEINRNEWGDKNRQLAMDLIVMMADERNRIDRQGMPEQAHTVYSQGVTRLLTPQEQMEQAQQSAPSSWEQQQRQTQFEIMHGLPPRPPPTDRPQFPIQPGFPQNSPYVSGPAN